VAANALRLERLRQNRKSVIPRAEFARGIRFVLEFEKKQITRCARDDNIIYLLHALPSRRKPFSFDAMSQEPPRL
jgi:hypothetical protein